MNALGNQDKTRQSKLQFCHQSKPRKHVSIPWMTATAPNATPYLRNKMQDGCQRLNLHRRSLGFAHSMSSIQTAIGCAGLAHTMVRYSQETCFDILSLPLLGLA